MTDFSSLLLRALLEQVTVFSPSHHYKCQQTANIVKNWVYDGDCGNIYSEVVDFICKFLLSVLVSFGFGAEQDLKRSFNLCSWLHFSISFMRGIHKELSYENFASISGSQLQHFLVLTFQRKLQ